MNISKETEMILKAFDDLYTKPRDIARKWNTDNTIPVIVIEEVSKILINNAGGVSLPGMPKFKKEYIKTIRDIVKRCKIAAKRMDSKSVPESLLKEYIDTIKTVFSKSSKIQI